ncbi:hypothetical protein MED121_03711 [Marinomonas sp. MED121]|uniref:DUF1127 domain-containing protein n=1 Tax=Marinomonas sp. MED121 TaxID=314277 RepID=UPI00006905C3|nr:DUF1127 domain-containing protein [Marinomonas sp. MED121]EAQ63062.1 hypothetical protein MED121_03711 [Marinomonas sp. MED121]
MSLLYTKQNHVCLKQVQAIKLNALEKIINHFSLSIKRIQHNRRTRQHLMTLNEYQLKDIGITKAEAYEELKKPLWK